MKKPLIDYICETCNKTFKLHRWKKPQKYCSVKCYAQGRRKLPPSFNCAHCGIQFFDTKRMKKRKYCSRACIQKSYHATWKPTYSCIRKRLQIKGLIKECEKCGYSEHPEILGVHHIDENRKNNALANLIILCPNCHSIEHRKHISH